MYENINFVLDNHKMMTMTKIGSPTIKHVLKYLFNVDPNL